MKLAEPNVMLSLTAPIAPQPELRMREDTPRKAVAAPALKPAVLSRPHEAARPGPPGVSPDARALSGEAARKAGEQIAQQLFYPPEAIERGLQGETLVLLFLDEAGNAIAARIEASSGHPLLDEAAVRAARTLRSLPANSPREAIVPVRFRLR